MKKCYTRQQALLSIVPRHDDTPDWRSVMKMAPMMESLMTSRVNRNFKWRCTGSKATLDNSAIIIERTARIWNHQGIWGQWMRKRYTRQKALSSIAPRHNDMVGWRSVMKLAPKMESFMTCEANRNFKWKCIGSGATLGNT